MKTAQVLYDLVDYMASPGIWKPEVKWGRLNNKEVSPMMGLSEDKENVYAKLVIPGVDRDEIKISVENNVLRVSGKKTKPSIEGKALHRGRWYGEFSRAIDLSPEIDAENITAKCEDGILTITMPKEESAKPKQIKVN